MKKAEKRRIRCKLKNRREEEVKEGRRKSRR